MNKTAAFEMTIVVPLYNEEDNLDRLAARLSDFLPYCLRKACVLFVNDGSTDGSAAKLHSLCAARPDFFCLELERNMGLSAALKAGFDACASPLAGYMDADLQTDPEDFNLLIGQIGDHALATGVRTDRHDSGWKKFQSRIANAWRRMMTGDGASDTCCPLKLIRSDYARRMPAFRGMHRFLPALVQLEGGTYVEVSVRHYPRTAGQSKYHLWNRVWTSFTDCFGYRWMKSRHFNYRIKTSNLTEE